MKQLIKLSLLWLALLLPATATAYDFEVDGIYYNINGNEAIVTYQSYSNGSYFSDYSGDVTIPETVTYNGNTYSVTSIGECAFNNCSVLTSITIGNTVTSIDFGAFASCSTLTSVTIPNSVTSIGANAFQDCSALTSVTIGNSVISIDDWAFNGCSALTSIDIPNSVTSISAWAFSGCSALASVTIGNSVTHISDFAFYDCSRLTNIIVDRNNPVYDSRDNCNAIIETALNTIIVGSANTVIPNSVTSIGNYAFRGCSGLTGELNITNSVTEIGFEAFAWCNGLTSVVIGNSVTSIGNAAFRDCSGLTSISIGNSVTSIGNDAFRNCNRLTSVNIGNSVTSIGEYAFFDCTELHSLIFNAVNCTSIGYRAFTCNPFYFFTISVPCLQFGDSVQHIPAGLPNFDMSGKTLIIPNSVKTINASAINGNCAAVVIGNSLENIAAGTFPSDISVAYATTAEPLPCEAGAFANPQTLYVPTGCRMKYFIAQGWGEFANIIEGEYIVADSIIMDNTDVDLSKGTTLQLNATVLPETASTNTVYWYSTNPSIASVNGDGMVTGISVGETDIVACADNVTSICHVTVTPVLVGSITLNANHLLMALDEMCILTVTAITPDNAENRTLEWEIPDNDVIATQLVNNTRLNIGAIGEGTVTITVRATDGSGVSASCVVTVSQIIIQATSIVLDETSARLIEGETLQLTATVLPEDATDKTVTWASSDETIATVTSEGLVTAIATGSATITATTNDGTDISTACLVTVRNPASDNCFVMPDTAVLHGDTVVIPVRMMNTEEIFAFQTDIYLPEEFSLVTDEDDEYIVTPSERLSSDHVFMTNDYIGGTIRVICYTPNSLPIGGNSGDDLFYVTIRVPEDASGDYVIYLRNSRLTTADYTELRIPDAGAVITVKSFIPGDANDSRTVTVTDIVVTAQYILHMNPQPFVFEAADMNGDGDVTVTDIMLIAYLINHPTMNAPRRMPVIMGGNDRMSGENICLNVGETRRVSIVLDNEMDYSAFQMDLTLPEGLTASNFALTDRAGSHAFDESEIGDGKLRALCYSPAFESIDGHIGALLTFDVTAKAAIEGDITVDGIELVTTDCQTVLFDGFTIGVNTATSVNELIEAKTVARVDYFNLAGQQIDRPGSGVTLVVTTYTDGTRSTTKVIK